MRTIVGREDELDAIGRSWRVAPAARRFCCSRAAGDRQDDGLGGGRARRLGVGMRVLSARPSKWRRGSRSRARDLLAGALDAVAAELPDPQRRALEVALAAARSGRSAARPQAIAFAFLSVLRALARTAPTLVAVDDLQWLDQPTAAMLAYAARRLGDEPIRLLLARAPTADWTRIMARGARRSRAP